MKLFNQIISVKTDAAAVERAQNFAEKVIGTVSYADSNQTDRQKIRDDHFVSKIGEEAVRRVFEQLGCAVAGPDYTIYEGKRKSWEEDLLIDKMPLAVKTQKRSAALRYGLSWTFQQSGFRNDPILERREAWVCFVECDDLQGFACSVFPPFQIGELPFKPPRLAHLLGKKQVVYASDLNF